MQYYIKFYNRDTGDFIGYYKEIGKNVITTMPNGTKYFNELASALEIAIQHHGGFLRDRDGHYYTTFCVVYGDSKREPKYTKYCYQRDIEEEKNNAINTVIRKSGNFNER